ncbi:hypothetical protein WKG86_10440 [Pantoea agglomerans]|uniref:hypothetical protein n=1 Tax=Enterobacter agglomerans TaxID=549 RepID=UPI003C7DFA96
MGLVVDSRLIVPLLIAIDDAHRLLAYRVSCNELRKVRNVGTDTFLQRFSWQAESRQKMALKRLSDAIQQVMKNFSSSDLKAITE